MYLTRSVRIRAAAAAGALSAAGVAAALTMGGVAPTTLFANADSSAPSTTSTTVAHHDDAHVTGTVASVSGTTFTVTTDDTKTVTVTTTDATHITKTSTAAVADIRLGDHIAGGAERIAILPAPTDADAPGKVTEIDGAAITVTTEDGTRTITTTAGTEVTRTTAATMADVTTGAAVAARGTKGADGSIAADDVNVGVKPAAQPRTPAPPARKDGEGAEKDDDPRSTKPDADHEPAHTAGTVTAVGANGFTVTTGDGKTVTVTTDADTKFHETRAASVGDIKVGDHIAGDAENIAILPAPKDTAAPGRVTKVDGATITVTTKDGTRTITTTADTHVTRTTDGTLADVETGDTVMVHGDESPDGSILARQVQLGAKPAVRPGPAPRGDDHRGGDDRHGASPQPPAGDRPGGGSRRGPDGPRQDG